MASTPRRIPPHKPVERLEVLVAAVAVGAAVAIGAAVASGVAAAAGAALAHVMALIVDVGMERGLQSVVIPERELPQHGVIPHARQRGALDPMRSG